MRILPVLLCLATPAAAWDFSPLPLCTLSLTTEVADLTITHDATLPEYRLTIMLRDQTWPEAPNFGLVFDGGLPPSISTSRHVLSDNGDSLSVTDTGFGNVLTGLETARVARAVSGARMIEIPLEGIADPMAAFRACPQVTLSGLDPASATGQTAGQTAGQTGRPG